MQVKVNIINDFSSGFNTHNFIPPVVPPPPPTPVPSVEMIATQLWPPGYALNQNKLTVRVTHKGLRIVLDGHDCGVMIPDVTIPPTNVYYAIMWPFSARKVAFSASMEQMDGTATGCADLTCPMMTCGNPATLPTAFVVNNFLNTVVVGMTVADIIAGWVGIGASIAFDFLTKGTGIDAIDNLFPMANPIKFFGSAVTGLIISVARNRASHGEYPISLSLQPTSPWFGGSFQVSWSSSQGLQVQSTTNELGDQRATQWNSRTGWSHPNQSYGTPLNPPDGRSGWHWSDLHGCSTYAMSTARKPARERYDAIVDLFPAEMPTRVYTLFKQTWDFSSGRPRLTEPLPLLHDFRAGPPILVGTDFWMEKEATDLVVHGSAFAPAGRPTTGLTVLAQIGAVARRIAVIGPRPLTWGGDGKPRMGAPAPFTEMSLTYDNAYGGVDPRVPAPPDASPLQLHVDHPGLYPRNPFGRGYLVMPGPLEGASLPTLEDPDDRLTDERLLVGDPARWWEQPLPAGVHFFHVMMFPRYLFAGAGGDAWFPAPEDERLPEVRRGYLMKGYRTALARRDAPRTVHPRFYQEASLGMVVPRLAGDEPVRLEGMHPDKPVIHFELPSARPSVELLVEGRLERVAPRLHHLVLRPAEEKLTMVWGASAPLPRPFIPGIHKHIPVAAIIDGDAPLAYEAPTPVLERLRAAGVKIP